jgi:hypothetical protein
MYDATSVTGSQICRPSVLGGHAVLASHYTPPIVKMNNLAQGGSDTYARLDQYAILVFRSYQFS